MQGDRERERVEALFEKKQDQEEEKDRETEFKDNDTVQTNR